MASSGTQLPPSHNAGNGVASNGYNGQPAGYSKDATASTPATSTGQRRSGRAANIVLALLLAVSIALAAAPVAGYKSGWCYYRRNNYVVPARLRIPIPVKLEIWVGWIKGSNSITNRLFAAGAPGVNEYTYLHEVRESGQVVAGLAIAFLLVSGAVGFLYFLACLFFALRGSKRSPSLASIPGGLGIAGIIFGFLNMAWSIACYIVIAVGTSIYTRRTLQATYVCWPDWCFWLAFFSGVFWLITAGIALGERKRARRAGTGTANHNNNMTHNMAYNNGNHPQGAMYDSKPGPVV